MCPGHFLLGGIYRGLLCEPVCDVTKCFKCGVHISKELEFCLELQGCIYTNVILKYMYINIYPIL